MGRKHNKNKKQKTGKGLDAKQLADKLLHFLDQHYGKAFNAKQLANRLSIKDPVVRGGIDRLLQQLIQKGDVSKDARNAYSSTKEPQFFEGEVDYVNPRFAYVILDASSGLEEDVIIKESLLKHALDGDRVRIMVFPGRNHSGRLEGRVLEVLSRAREEFVGRIEISPRFAFVVPDFRKMHQDIFIPKDQLHGAQHNQKVVVKMHDWKEDDKNPIGSVVRVLGKAGEHEVEMHSIIAEFGLPFEYPEEPHLEAEAISDKISEEEIAKRKDFREVCTFTIDPADAKDFDDAISYRKLENGLLEVGVHIADVTHYVQPRTALEREAYERATSVYLVDRTIPMLPERLSNGLCSLRPHEDKLTFSCVFEIDDSGKVHKQWIGRTVIHSDRRFAYEEAQENIDQASGDFHEELTHLNTIAKALRAKRFEQGAINFETVEVKFRLDEKGVPQGLMVKERKDIHKMIEEFMLLANKAVATFIYSKNNGKDTFVYRTHDRPDEDRLETFGTFAKRFGHSLKLANMNQVAAQLNALMENIQGKPEQNVLEQLAIRSMAKAKYTTEPKGHFGLAFSHYTHFTSPIRRYPDMMVHRLLQHYLDGGKSPDAEPWEVKCTHSSEREKRASDAERASIKYKQVEYMSLAEDRPYPGIITGVTEWGVYVEMTETKCEGMVRVADMDDDFYDFDEKNMRLIGRKNKKMYTLGDAVTVRVTATDINRRTIDLEFD